MELLLTCTQNYVVLLDSTLPRSQYDYVLPQVSFTAVGYHKHITLIFNPTVRRRGSSGTAYRDGERRKTVQPVVRVLVEGGHLLQGPQLWVPFAFLISLDPFLLF